MYKNMHSFMCAGKALQHGSMWFPQYELCVGILQAGQGQKSDTNGCGRVRKRLLLDHTKQRMNANENCTQATGMESLCTLIGSKGPRPLAEIVSCPMHETT